MIAACAAAPRVLAQSDVNWGGPVLDTHLHLRAQRGRVLHAHARLRRDARRPVDPRAGRGAGEGGNGAPARPLRAIGERPIRRAADADKVLRDALKAGAVSIGEMKYPRRARLARDAARLRCRRRDERPGDDAHSGLSRICTAKCRTTRAIRSSTRCCGRIRGRSSSATATCSGRISAPTSRRIAAIPAGQSKPGGLTDKWLCDFPNFYGDMSANSGNNALSRDTGLLA